MKKQTSDGFTVAELVVAIVVGTILLFGLASLVNSIRIINARSQDNITVNSLVENKVEEIRGAGFDALADGSYDFSTEIPQTIPAGATATYTVATVSGNVGLKEVVIEVSYEDYGDPLTYRYTTYVGELGIGQY